MAKKSSPKHVEPEDISQEVPEEEPAAVIDPTPETSAAAMSKADACRAALAAGIDTAEKAIEFVRSKFGVEIKASDFTVYKSKARKVAAPAVKAKPGRKPKPLVDGYVAPPEKPKGSGEPDMLLALESVKELVGQFGADKLKRIVDLLG